MSIKCNHISLFEGQGNRLSTSERLGLRCVTKKRIRTRLCLFSCFSVLCSEDEQNLPFKYSVFLFFETKTGSKTGNSALFRFHIDVIHVYYD